MPNDRFDDAWSLSAKCMEKDVVLGKTTRILAVAGYAMNGIYSSIFLNGILDTNRDIIMEIYRDIYIIYIYTYIYNEDL